MTASARSTGVGEKLIEGIRALARERGDTRVIWTTGEDNAGSQRFYDRLGMRREKKVYFVMDVWLRTPCHPSEARIIKPRNSLRWVAVDGG